MVTLFVQCDIQKTRTQNTQWKQRYRWKWYLSVTRRNVRHFPPASGRMTPASVCLWRHREHGDGNKRWRQRRFEPTQDTSVKKMVNGNVSSEFILLWFTSGTELQVLSKTASRLWIYAYKKYKNSNSARRTASKRQIRPAICSGGSDNFSSGISGKLPKIETSNVIFS